MDITSMLIGGVENRALRPHRSTDCMEQETAEKCVALVTDRKRHEEET